MPSYCLWFPFLGELKESNWEQGDSEAGACVVSQMCIFIKQTRYGSIYYECSEENIWNW